MIFANAYLRIDLDAISANFRAIGEKAGVPVMAVVKADAYGHGAVPVARLLEKQCAFFGVSSVQEALELRLAGIAAPILILGHTPVEAFRDIVREGIRVAIFCYEDAAALSQEAQRQGVTAAFHFAVDTGMSRIGFQATEESADICAQIAALPNLTAEGLFSHFATADETDLSRTVAQAEQFDAFDRMLRERGVAVRLRHLDNSAGLINFSAHYDMVRAGIVIYGLYPSGEVPAERLPLVPALSWYSRVTHVKLLEPGRQISYGGTFVTEKPTTVATVAVGYADGYRRSLSNRFYVLIHGKKARILGRVCMDQIVVDVTDIPGVRPEDPVVLVGCDGDERITVEQIAEVAGTFNYEFICGLSRRDTRAYIQNGEIVEKIDYLFR